MGFGDYPAEYNPKIHGPYDPARYYGKADIPFGQVKLGELKDWLMRRNKTPNAVIAAISRETIDPLVTAQGKRRKGQFLKFMINAITHMPLLQPKDSATKFSSDQLKLEISHVNQFLAFLKKAHWRWLHKYVLPKRTGLTPLIHICTASMLFFYVLNYKKMKAHRRYEYH